MKTIEIKAGTKLHFSRTEKFKTTMVCVLFRRPLTRSEATMNALLPGVLKGGSEKYPSWKEINTYMDQLYGGIFDVQIIKKGEEQLLQFYIEVLNSTFASGLLDKALFLLGELIYKPKLEAGSFGEAVVEREKDKLKLYIDSKMNNKSEYLRQKCLESMCHNDGFGIDADGYKEDIDRITAKALYEHYQKVIIQSPVEFAVMGDEDESKVLAGIHRAFGQYLSANPLFIKPARPYEKGDRARPARNEENLGLSQDKIAMAFGSGIPATGKDFYGFLLFSEILGGGANARLFVNIREKENLCYNISSFIYRFKGILMIECGVDQQHTEKTLALIRKEIEEMKAGNFPLEQVQEAKDSLIKTFLGFQDHPAALVDFSLSQYLLGDVNGLHRFTKGIAQGTKEDIICAANRLFEDTVYILR